MGDRSTHKIVEFCYLTIPKLVAIILSLTQMRGVVGTVGITTACRTFMDVLVTSSKGSLAKRYESAEYMSVLGATLTVDFYCLGV